MAKSAAKVVESATQVSFSSLKDSAYQQAGAAKTLEDVARYVLGKVKDFPKEISTEAKDELYEGYRMKFNLLKPEVMYAVINDHYVIATQEHKTNDKVEKVNIGIPYAYSYSAQEFGKLANTNPALHALVKEIREKCSTYCSNRLGDLKRAATKILKEGQEGQARTANKNFGEFIEDWFKEAAPTRLISAKNRGDKTADDKRWNEAKVAFMVKWKHSEAK